MNDYHLTFKPTATERREHVARIRKMATDIADKITRGDQLTDAQRDFASFMVREWSDKYEPKRSRGQAPVFSHVDAALHYALLRDQGRAHPLTLASLLEHCDDRGNYCYPVTEIALWKAIRPIYPDACSHLSIAPKPIPE